MTPTREFLDNNPTMLAEMIADFQQRKKMVDMAKTKEPIDANVIENPNLRAFIPYPKLMYNHAKHITQMVENAEQHRDLLDQGWKEQPWPVFDASIPLGPQTTSDSMVDERLDTLERQMLDMQQALGDILAQLQFLSQPEKRKPGRPPSHPQE